MRYLVVLSCLLLACLPTVEGSGCRVVAVRKHVVHDDYSHVVAAVKVVQVVQPYYYGYYVPPPADPGNIEALRGLAEQLKAINDRLQRLEGSVPGKPEVPPQPPTMNPADPRPGDPFNPPQALKGGPAASCVACHDRGVADSKGGGFVFSENGKVKQLSGEDLGKVIEQVTTNRMPKRPHSMTAEERLAFVALLVGGK